MLVVVLKVDRLVPVYRTRPFSLRLIWLRRPWTLLVPRASLMTLMISRSRAVAVVGYLSRENADVRQLSTLREFDSGNPMITPSVGIAQASLGLKRLWIRAAALRIGEVSGAS